MKKKKKQSKKKQIYKVNALKTKGINGEKYSTGQCKCVYDNLIYMCVSGHVDTCRAAIE
jgi:hypothetical protein